MSEEVETFLCVISSRKVDAKFKILAECAKISNQYVELDENKILYFSWDLKVDD